MVRSQPSARVQRPHAAIRLDNTHRSVAIDPVTGEYLGPVTPAPCNTPPIRTDIASGQEPNLDRLLATLSQVAAPDLRLLHLQTRHTPALH